MDYKKKYEQALEKMKAWAEGKYPECFDSARKTAELIFPELKESEDEKTRKAIIEFFELQDDDTTYSFIPKKDILAWLEKQGEQKESSCDRCKRAQPSHSCQDITELGRCYLEHEKQGEQNQLKKIEQEYHCTGVCEPKEATGALKQLLNKENYAWSEEDETIFNSIIEDVMPYGECPDYPSDKEREYFYEGNRKVEWLKSLKDRYTWIPSKENNVDKS